MEFNGEADNARAPPSNVDLSCFVNNVKTTSSRFVWRELAHPLNRIYRKPEFWSRIASFRAPVRRRR
jgi:putative transposase